MPLKINTIRSSKHNSIEELYTEDLNDCKEDYQKEKYNQLISLTRLINNMFPNTDTWALTSIDRLVLMNEDDWKSNWYIIISNIGTKKFYFEYLIPSTEAPWENAYVKGVAKNLDEAKVHLLRSMSKSNGWSQREELK
jgi:hypothetical protein